MLEGLGFNYALRLDDSGDRVEELLMFNAVLPSGEPDVVTLRKALGLRRNGQPLGPVPSVELPVEALAAPDEDAAVAGAPEDESPKR